MYVITVLKGVAKAYSKNGLDRCLKIKKSKTAEQFTVERGAGAFNQNFDASEGEESGFGNDKLYSYLPGSCTDGLDLPGAGISQSQDDS